MASNKHQVNLSFFSSKFINLRGCGVVVSTSEHDANEHRFELYSEKIIFKNYFSSAVQEAELFRREAEEFAC